VPVLRSNAAWTEENRRLHDETVDALADAGIFKMRVPARYGGYESDTGTLVAVASELGRGDGSASWVASVCWITSWMVGLFPDAVQDEVFGAAGPDASVVVCGTLSPSAMATTVDGGVVMNGQWGFISGALHSQWQVVIAINPMPDGTPLPIMAVVPLAELAIIDDWYTAGLRGTGSVTTVAQDLFVPQHRVLPLPAILQEQYASQLNADSPIFRSPLLPTASATSIGTAVGLAKAAREAFFQRLPERGISYTSYASQREAPLTHLQVADATLRIDAAEFHATRLAALVDAKSANGESWKLEERAQARADMGRVVQLAKEAIDILNNASGGSSVYSSVPIQRIERDIQTVNLHALMHPNTNFELYGRVLCDLEPNTLYI
jgi:alkylation response protein AidB-like acyl-CoA dehydrogenase